MQSIGYFVLTNLSSSFGIINGPMNRMFDFEVATIFVDIETLSMQVIYFYINN